MTLTYWLNYPRGFANEYTVGIATTKEDGEQYEAEGFERTNREHALMMMSQRSTQTTQIYAIITINGKTSEWERGSDRFEIARAIRTGSFRADTVSNNI